MQTCFRMVKGVDVVSCSFMGAAWNVRTRQLWYIFDADVVTVLEERTILIGNWRVLLDKQVLDQ